MVTKYLSHGNNARVVAALDSGRNVCVKSIELYRVVTVVFILFTNVLYQTKKQGPSLNCNCDKFLSGQRRVNRAFILKPKKKDPKTGLSYNQNVSDLAQYAS